MYTWDQIESHWLGGSDIACSPQQAVAAFNKCISLFGQDWVEGTRSTGQSIHTGTSPTLHIVALGTMLNALADVCLPETFLRKLAAQGLDFQAELEAMYLILSGDSNADIEYEPTATVGNTIRKPDFRTSLDMGDWVYVEATRPSISEAQTEVNQHLKRLASAVEVGSGAFTVEVFLEREPSGTEVEAIYSDLVDPRNQELTGSTPLTNGLGTLYWNADEPGQASIDDHGLPFSPRIGVLGARKDAECNRHVLVRWPFADGRAEEILRKEAKQLPVDCPGLIMVQVSAASGATSTWKPAIERRFQPNIHTRVSGVCIWTTQLVNTPRGEDWQFWAELIANPHARHPLPQWITQQLQWYSPSRSGLIPERGPDSPNSKQA